MNPNCYSFMQRLTFETSTEHFFVQKRSYENDFYSPTNEPVGEAILPNIQIKANRKQTSVNMNIKAFGEYVLLHQQVISSFYPVQA